MREAKLSTPPPPQKKKRKRNAKCFPRSQHGGSILFHTHKSDQLKIEMHYTLDKQFQTLIKADFGVGINSNLHLVMFHIWTLNVLREKRKLKIHTQLHYWNIDCSLRIVQSSSEIPGGSLRQYLLSNTLPWLTTSLYALNSTWGFYIL